MSRQVRYRVAALVLGGSLLGGPLVAGGAASAEQPRIAIVEAAHRVTFGGSGAFSISCHSHPDVESMVVPAGSTVRVVNRTGHDANLALGRDNKGMLPDSQATDVVFRRGTTAMTLTPNCPLDSDSSPVMITAQPTPSATSPDVPPSPAGSDSSASSTFAPDSRNPSDSAAPNTFSAPVHATHPHLSASRPAAVHRHRHRPAAASTATAAVADPPSSDAAAPVKTKVKGGLSTPGAASPAFSGMPLGEQKALAPSVPGIPDVDLVPPTGPAPTVLAAPTAEVPAAEPVAAMAPIVDQGPLGLLAAIATVCALGVGIAAIRAFVSQRANRSKVA